MGTATSLAKRAGVSDPTVVRLVMKLGFAGFPDFQSNLMAEVEARLHSPLLMMETKQLGKSDENVVLSYMASIDKAIERWASATPIQSYDRASRLIVEPKGRIVLLGGRFSRDVAAIFAGYLIQLRPAVIATAAISST